MDIEIPIGNVQFGIIQVDLEAIAAAVQVFALAGSVRGGITRADLTIVSDRANVPALFVDVAQALEHGTRFFDAVYYFLIPEGQRPAPRAAVAADLPPTREPNDVGKAVFYQCFSLLTRGAPVLQGNEPPAVSGFLTNVMGLNEPADYYCDVIASFNITQIDWRFIRHINWAGLGQEAINRLGLGVAGYRNFAPFKAVIPRNAIPARVANAYALALHIATTPYDWDVHSVTRSPNLITYLGNLNANLRNLMLDVYTEAELNEMVNVRMLFNMPLRDPRHMDYLRWPDMINLTNPIFPQL